MFNTMAYTACLSHQLYKAEVGRRKRAWGASPDNHWAVSTLCCWRTAVTAVMLVNYTVCLWIGQWFFISPSLSPVSKEGAISVCKTNFMFNSTNKAVYLGFVGLSSPKELGMWCVFRRVTSASQGMSLVKRMLGKALRKAAHTLLYVVILFF